MTRQVILFLASLLTLSAIPLRAQEKAQQSGFTMNIGGGIGVPLNPSARFAGLGGAFQVGAGPRLNKHSSIIGEFMWHGLPPNRGAFAPIVNPQVTNNSFGASVNLYALTANYMFHIEGHRYGYYVIGGGGWYYRYAQLQNYTVAPGTICSPSWDWWGYVCQSGLVPTSNVLAARGVSSGGVNVGAGVTIRLTGAGLKFYMEARYHYSPQGGNISTQIVPVTFGIRW